MQFYLYLNSQNLSVRSCIQAFFKCDPGITLIYCFDFQVDRVIFCLFLGVDVKIYEHLMSVYFPVGESVAEEQSAGAVAAAAGQSISYKEI